MTKLPELKLGTPLYPISVFAFIIKGLSELSVPREGSDVVSPLLTRDSEVPVGPTNDV